MILFKYSVNKRVLEMMIEMAFLTPLLQLFRTILNYLLSNFSLAQMKIFCSVHLKKQTVG